LLAVRTRGFRVRDIVWTRPSASSPLTSPGAVMVPGNGTNWPLSMDVRAPRLHCPQRSYSIGCNGEPAVGHLTSWFQVTRHGYTRVATTALASSETFFATVAQNASPKGSGTRRLSKLRAERREVRKPRVQRLDSCAAGLVAYGLLCAY